MPSRIGHPSQLLTTSHALQNVQQQRSITSLHPSRQQATIPPTQQGPQQSHPNQVLPPTTAPVPSSSTLHWPCAHQQPLGQQLASDTIPPPAPPNANLYPLYDPTTGITTFLSLEQLVTRELLARGYQHTIDCLKHDLGVSQSTCASLWNTMKDLEWRLAADARPSASILPPAEQIEAISTEQMRLYIAALEKQLMARNDERGSVAETIANFEDYRVTVQASSKRLREALVSAVKDRCARDETIVRLEKQVEDLDQAHRKLESELLATQKELQVQGMLASSLRPSSPEDCEAEQAPSEESYPRRESSPIPETSQGPVEPTAGSVDRLDMIKRSGTTTAIDQPSDGATTPSLEHVGSMTDESTQRSSSGRASDTEDSTTGSLTISLTARGTACQVDRHRWAILSSPAFQAKVKELHAMIASPSGSEGDSDSFWTATDSTTLSSGSQGGTSRKRSLEADTSDSSRKSIKLAATPGRRTDSTVTSSPSSTSIGVEYVRNVRDVPSGSSASESSSCGISDSETISTALTTTTETTSASERLWLLVKNADQFHILFTETADLVDFMRDTALSRGAIIPASDVAGRDTTRKAQRWLKYLDGIIGGAKKTFEAAIGP